LTRHRAALAGGLVVALVAGVNVFGGIADSALYLDEGLSWKAASGTLAQLEDRVRDHEVGPPTYFAGLKAWIDVGGRQGEGFLRVPSALAAVLLALAAAWCAVALGGRRSALLAGLLVAASPVLVEYGQQARAYVFATLLVVLAAAAALRMQTDPRRRWLVACAAGCAAALWVHYTAGLVVLPLLVAIGLARRHPPVERAIAVAAVAGAGLALIPLASHQLGRGHEEGVAPQARLTLENLVEVAGGPFYGRSEAVTIVVVLGALAVLAACALLLRRGDPRERLLVACALAAPLGCLLVTLVADDVLIARYAVVSAPFALIVLARAPLALAAVALVLAVVGSVASHLPGGRYPAYDRAFATVRADWRPGDLVVVDNLAFLGPLVEYYSRGIEGFAAAGTENQGAAAGVAGAQRLWLVTEREATDAEVGAGARATGRRLVRAERFRTRGTVGVFLLGR
jgi:hypothetical protein